MPWFQPKVSPEKGFKVAIVAIVAIVAEPGGWNWERQSFSERLMYGHGGKMIGGVAAFGKLGFDVQGRSFKG